MYSRQESENIMSLKQLTPNKKIPLGLLAQGPDAIRRGNSKRLQLPSKFIFGFILFSFLQLKQLFLDLTLPSAPILLTKFCLEPSLRPRQNADDLEGIHAHLEYRPGVVAFKACTQRRPAATASFRFSLLMRQRMAKRKTGEKAV